MKKLLSIILSLVCICMLFTSCGEKEKAPEKEESSKIAPVKQEVVTFDEDLNVTYGNTCSAVPMAEDDDNYYFMYSPKVKIVPKDDDEEQSGFKIFTDECEIIKFIVFEGKIYVVNEEDGLVTCDVKGNNIQVRKHNEKKITDIYIENKTIYFVTEGEEEGTADIYAENTSDNYYESSEYESNEKTESVVEKIATIEVDANSISDFAAVGTDVYVTYTDEYDMKVLMKINGIAQLPLQSLPPEFCQKNKAFTDGGYIYMSSSINKIVRYDILNNNVSEIATVGEPINAKNGYIYIINQTSLKDVEIISYNVKTQEAKILYKNSDNNLNDDEYLDENNIRVMIKSLGVFDDGKIVFVEEYTNNDGEQLSQTYTLDEDKYLEKV